MSSPRNPNERSDGQNREIRIGDDALDVLGRETNLRSVEAGYEEVLAGKAGPPRWIYLVLSIVAILGFFGLRALTPEPVRDDPDPNAVDRPALDCRFERLVDTSALVLVANQADERLRMTAIARRWDEDDQTYHWLATTNRRIPIDPGGTTELFLPAPDKTRAQLVVVLAVPDARDPMSDPEIDELLETIRRFDPDSNAMYGLQTHALRIRRAVPGETLTFPVMIPAQ